MTTPPPTDPIRVAIVDDHPIFRAGLVAALDGLSGIVVVAQAGDGDQAVDMVAQHHPDVVLMDLRMPGLSGLAATAHISAHHPATAVVVLTMSEDDDSVFAALRAGARGYLLKEADSDDIHRVLLAVGRGEAVFGPRIAQRLVTFFTSTLTQGPAAPVFPQLTDRERDVLGLLAHGLDNPAIARRLVLSEKTVRNRVSDILTKLQARTRADAISLARDAGLGRTTDTPPHHTPAARSRSPR